MTMNRDEVEAELDVAWQTFEDDLADYLTGMTDPEERDHLIVELPDPAPDGAGCTPYAQCAAFGDGTMLRVEVSGNRYLAEQYRLGDDGCHAMLDAGWAPGVETGDPANWHVDLPVDRSAVAAAMVVAALRSEFGIVHPQLLTHQAWGPAATELATLSLGLLAEDEVPTEPTLVESADDGSGDGLGQRALALVAGDRDELVAMVANVLHGADGEEPDVDDDGDFVLDRLGQPVWVRVRREQPAIEIMARVVLGVRSRRATAVEVSLLNRDNMWARWVLRERAVWQTIVLPAEPFAPGHLTAMLDLFTQAMAATRDDLALRTGGRVG